MAIRTSLQPDDPLKPKYGQPVPLGGMPQFGGQTPYDDLGPGYDPFGSGRVDDRDNPLRDLGSPSFAGPTDSLPPQSTGFSATPGGGGPSGIPQVGFSSAGVDPWAKINAATFGGQPPSVPTDLWNEKPRGGAQRDPFNDMVRSRLENFMSAAQKPVRATDPELAPAISAFTDQQNRGSDARRQIQGERLAQQGQTADSGAMAASNERAVQDAADASSNYAANLVYQEMQARRDALAQGLSIGQNILTPQEQQQMERELANMDANLRQQALNLQGVDMGLGFGLDVDRLGLEQRGQDINQMLGLGSLGNQRRGQDIDRELGLGGLDVQRGRLGLDTELGRGALGIDQGRLDLERLLGQGGLDLSRSRLDLDRLLGEGGLDLQRGRLGLDTELGRSDIDLRKQLGQGDLDLRKLLGTSDIDLRRYGIDQQSLLGNRELDVRNSLGQGDLAIRGELGRGQLNMQLLQALLGDRQFNDSLGFDIGKFMALLNQNAVTSVL